MTTEITVVHTNGSDTLTDIAHIEENLTGTGETELLIWEDNHSGEPDETLSHGSITAVTPGDTS